MRYDNRTCIPKAKYVDIKLSMLEEFGILRTKEIEDTISALYPNECRIEKYTRSLIIERLNEAESRGV